MPKGKKGIRLSENMPIMSVESLIQRKPIGSTRGKAANKEIVCNPSDCREEIIWNVREGLQQVVTQEKRRSDEGSYWDTRRVVTHEVNLSDSYLKQYGKTKLIVDWVDDFGGAVFHRCCLQNMVRTMDTLVGNLNLVLDPDPYYGEWWRGPAAYDRDGTFSYYGVNNSCLQHPAILHIVLGMFRQALIVFTDGEYEGLLKAVPYKDTEKALTNADWKQAWKNLEAARPWIEVGSTRGVGCSSSTFWPFPTGYWPRLRSLHRALYKKGPTKLFEQSSIAARWDLTGQSRGDSIIDGAWSYFGRGTNTRKLTAPGKRLFALGK